MERYNRSFLTLIDYLYDSMDEKKYLLEPYNDNEKKEKFHIFIKECLEIFSHSELIFQMKMYIIECLMHLMCKNINTKNVNFSMKISLLQYIVLHKNYIVSLKELRHHFPYISTDRIIVCLDQIINIGLLERVTLTSNIQAYYIYFPIIFFFCKKMSEKINGLEIIENNLGYCMVCHELFLVKIFHKNICRNESCSNYSNEINIQNISEIDAKKVNHSHLMKNNVIKKQLFVFNEIIQYISTFDHIINHDIISRQKEIIDFEKNDEL